MARLKAKLLVMSLLGIGFVVMTTGCSGESSSPSTTGRPPKDAQPAPVQSSAPDGLPHTVVKQVHSAPIAAPHRSWSAVVTAKSTRTIELMYLESIGAGCSTVYQANITESSEWVEIQLLTRNGDPHQPCAQSGVRTLTSIQLKSDLGSRDLLEPEGGT